MNINERKCIKRVPCSTHAQHTYPRHRHTFGSWCNLYTSFFFFPIGVLFISGIFFLGSLSFRSSALLLMLWGFIFFLYVFFSCVRVFLCNFCWGCPRSPRAYKIFWGQRQIFFDNDSYLFGVQINETWWVLFEWCDAFRLSISRWYRCANALIYCNALCKIGRRTSRELFRLRRWWWCFVSCIMFVSVFFKANTYFYNSYIHTIFGWCCDAIFIIFFQCFAQSAIWSYIFFSWLLFLSLSLAHVPPF